jgi:hypothetical protein
MIARNWYDRTIQPFAEDGQGSAARHDDDEALDDWLASLSAGQFDRILNFLMDHLGSEPSALDRPVA